MDLTQLEVKREYQNIDILLSDSVNKLAVVIENKVGSKQHGDQLRQYFKIAQQEFKNYKRMGVYLTPEGDDPENPDYVAFSYTQVRKLVQEVLLRDFLISDAVRSTLVQYADLLGRRFMADIELKQLCANIYKRHRQAIDILKANIPDDRGDLAIFLRELIDTEGFILDDSNNNYVRFIPKDLDLQVFLGSEGWTSSGRLVLFEFRLSSDSMILIIQMGPGSAYHRQLIHEFALANRPLFCPESILYAKWQRLFKMSILDSKEFDTETDKRLETIRKKWEEFLRSFLPDIRNKILNHEWPQPVTK